MRLNYFSYALILLIGFFFMNTSLATGKAKIDDDTQKFIGVWRLISATDKTAEGKVTHLFGENPLGYIIYTQEGIMSVELMQRDRKKFAHDQFRDATENELKDLMMEFYAYAGQYKIDEKQKIVTHYTAINIFPNDVNKSFSRRYEFKANQLLLKPVETNSERVIVWERVSEALKPKTSS